jgi:hypothetical protein
MRALCAIVLISCVVVLSGCSATPVMTATSTQPNQLQGMALHGRVHGGQQPVVGAKVYLYAVDATGYGKASDSLLKSPGYVTTDGSGNFSITSDYTCPSASTQVYLYAIGGDPTPGVANAAAGLLAGLGSCGTLSSEGASFPFIFVNEVSTVAMAYSLAGFATDATHISSSGSNLAVTDVANAFATIANLETPTTGVALATTLGNYGTVPQSEINTLANILAACINSTGPGSTGCTTLLGSALSGGTTGTPAPDTATAAINIAHHPGANVAALYGLQTGTPAFLPDLSPAPNDFSMAISFGPGPNNYGFFSDLAIDGSGNAWVVGGFGTSGDGAGEILASTLGWSSTTPMTGGGLSSGNPGKLAIDPSENVWLPINTGVNVAALVELSSSGTVLSGSGGFTSCSSQMQFGDAGALAVDGSGYVWLPSEDDVVWEYFPGTSCWNWYSGGGLNQPGPIAIDASGNAWTANGNSSSVSEFSSAGAVLSPSGFTGAGVHDPTQMAADAEGNIWISNYVTGSVSEYNSSGTELSTSSGYTSSSMSNNSGLAIDGAGNVWVSTGGSNGNPSLIDELNSSGTVISGSTGYTSSDLNAPNLLAVDGSGNLWVVNGGSTFIDEFVGLAAPVVTPKAANLTSPYGSHAVNLP